MSRRVCGAIAVALLGVSEPAPPRGDLLWTAAQVADASDRAYEPVAIALIDGARSSVVLAMYAIQDSEDPRHPVHRLLTDLQEAAARGVRVEVYLNTRFADTDEQVLAAPWVARLRQAGVTVTALSESRRWHGKLLVVDERYLLEGSTNWSVTALESNGESNTVMDAPALARQKLAHLRAWGVPHPVPSPAPVPEPPVPDTLSWPVAWLARDHLCAQLVTRGDERGLDVLLLLVRRAAAEATGEFSVDLDGLGEALALSTSWSRTHRRQEVLQILRRLQRRYGVVAVRVNRRRDAWVRLIRPDGPSAMLPSALTAPTRLVRQSAAATYLALLTEVVRQREGLDVSTMTYAALSERTGLTPKTLRRARRELSVP